MELRRPELLPDEPPGQDRMREIQKRVRELAIFEDRFDGRGDGGNETIGGVDAAYSDDDIIAAAVCMRSETIVDRTTIVAAVEFPYVPGYLAFREAGHVVSAISELSIEPDLVLVDGNGRIHPREAGLATHVGVVLDIPTIGVAKRLLCGTIATDDTGPYEAGRRIPVIAGERESADSGTVLGFAVQTRQWNRDPPIRPVFVSPGHRVSAETAVKIVLTTCTGYKLPEPIRAADRLAGEGTANEPSTATR